MDTEAKLVELWQHCADMGVMVEYVDLGPTRHGEYHHPDLIRISNRATGAQGLSALAHEVGHAVACEKGATANCSRADEYGAALVIEPEDYRAAELMVGEHAGALARYLGVTRRLVLAWRRWYLRTHPPLEVECDELP